MSFNELGLSAVLLRAVGEQGYEMPTPVQAQAIPAILEGGDIMAAAQTGTGKTAGFTLPLLQRLNESQRPPVRAPRALVLVPTRELAAQVQDSVRTYGKYLSLKSTVIFGGVGMNPQIQTLRRGVDIVVATPGRLLDHCRQRTVDLSHIEVLVLDEADRMLDMGFIHDIRKVLQLLPQQRQNLLFSATFSDDIRKLADRLLNAPKSIEVARRNTAAESVNQTIHPVSRGAKRALLSTLIRDNEWGQVLVFTRTKHGADRLAKQLETDGIACQAIHGNKSQSQRTRALGMFKQNRVRVLVATDIAARGLDIDQLPHVVNFELPNVAEDYVHRIGRTGRAGHGGEAVSLVCVDELKLLKGIERLLGRSIDRIIVPGFEPDPGEKPEPIFKTPGGRRGGSPGGNAQSRRARPGSQGKPRGRSSSRGRQGRGR
jgi:ATP-dependent RNA helicase RhlE